MVNLILKKDIFSTQGVKTNLYINGEMFTDFSSEKVINLYNPGEYEFNLKTFVKSKTQKVYLEDKTYELKIKTNYIFLTLYVLLLIFVVIFFLTTFNVEYSASNRFILLFVLGPIITLSMYFPLTKGRKIKFTEIKDEVTATNTEQSNNIEQTETSSLDLTDLKNDFENQYQEEKSNLEKGTLRNVFIDVRDQDATFEGKREIEIAIDEIGYDEITLWI